MKININSLATGINHFQFEKTGSELGIEQPDISKIEIRSEVSRIQESITVRSVSISYLKLCCDRCLRDFDYRLHDECTIYHTRDREAALSDDEEVVKILSPGTQEIDLATGLRESILLATPMKAICREDCKGLCQFCGENLNETTCDCKSETVDPRWAALKDLISKDTVE